MHSIVQRSPTGSIAANATGLYRAEGGITFGIVGDAGVGNPQSQSQSQVHSQTESALNLRLSQSPSKTPSRSRKITGSLAAGTGDHTMGLLRNGKPYSPTRIPVAGRGKNGNKQAPYTKANEADAKRKQRSSSGDYQFLQPSPKVNRANHHSGSAGSAGSMGPLPPPLQSPKQVQSFNLGEFMTKMENLVKTTVETAVQNTMKVAMEELKAEKAKDLEDIKSTIKTLENESKTASTEIAWLRNKSDDNCKKISDHNDDANRKFTEQNQKLDDAIKQLNERLDKVESGNLNLSTKVDNLRGHGTGTPLKEYPVETTIMIQRVVLKDGRDSMSVAKLILHDVLKLNSIKIVRSKVFRKYRNGTSTIQVQLESNAAVGIVLRNKSKLNRVQHDDLKSIWIMRPKSEQQKIVEYNYGVLLEELKLSDRIKSDSMGRLYQVDDGNEDLPTASAPTADVNQEAMDDGPSAGRAMTGGVTRGNAARGRYRYGHPGGGRSRGRGRVRGRGRGRGHGRGTLDAAMGGPSGSTEAPYHVDDFVINALTRARTEPQEDGNEQEASGLGQAQE